MIRYNRKITLDQKRNEQWQLNSDRGSTYDTLLYSNITLWWNSQAQTELRGWQKDICVVETANVFGRLELYAAYQKGHGWAQNHDICLVRNTEYNIWVLSTLDDYWICESDAGNIVFDRENSLGSIMNEQDRRVIYQIYDNLRLQYNPDYECRWVQY
jgi:hypothetical protein